MVQFKDVVSARWNAEEPQYFNVENHPIDTSKFVVHHVGPKPSDYDRLVSMFFVHEGHRMRGITEPGVLWNVRLWFQLRPISYVMTPCPPSAAAKWNVSVRMHDTHLKDDGPTEEQAIAAMADRIEGHVWPLPLVRREEIRDAYVDLFTGRRIGLNGEAMKKDGVEWFP